MKLEENKNSLSELEALLLELREITKSTNAKRYKPSKGGPAEEVVGSILSGAEQAVDDLLGRLFKAMERLIEEALNRVPQRPKK